MAAVGVLTFGFVADQSYFGLGQKPSQIAIVIAAFFAYLFPGIRLSRYAQKKADSPKWGEYIGTAVLFAWIGLAWGAARILSGLGY